MFIVFNSVFNNLLLIYSNFTRSIIFLDVNNNVKMWEIKNAHNNEYIINFRHFFDQKNNRDLFLSISEKDSNVKLWNINNVELLQDFQNVYAGGRLKSVCFLNNNKQIYIIAGNEDEYYGINVFDLNGNFIKNIYSEKDQVLFIDSYNEFKANKNLIIAGNYYDVKSYDFDKGEIYHIYKDKNDNTYEHVSLIIK